MAKAIIDGITINKWVVDCPHTGNTGGGGIDFTELGYDGTPKDIQDGYDYALEIKNNWDASVTNRRSAFSGDTKLVYFPEVDTRNVTNMRNMFYDCSYLSIFPTKLVTSAVTDMTNMFVGCTRLNNLDLSSFDTSNVTEMNYMFSNCNSLKTINVSSFNTSAVTNMNQMFNNCSALTSLDVSNFDTSNVTNFGDLFKGCGKLATLDLSNFNTSATTKMNGMFYNCSGLTNVDVSNFNTSKVTTMNAMFYGCKNLTSLDLSSFDTSNVTDFSTMLVCEKLEKVIGKLNLIKINSTISSSYFVGYSANKTLRKLMLENFGYGKSVTSANMSYINVWGVNSDSVPDAKQSLVDSLITYSYDRATAGYTTCSVTLHANTKAVLTTDEIAQITAKGITIA